MPVCAVYGCDTNHRNRQERGVKLHTFPKDHYLQKRWVDACQRKSEINTRNARICSMHFSKDAFEKPLIQRLLGYSPITSRTIKPDAIPTENLPNIADYEREKDTVKKLSGSKIYASHLTDLEETDNATQETFAKITPSYYTDDYNQLSSLPTVDVTQGSEICSFNSFEVGWRTQAGLLCRLCGKSDFGCVPIFRGTGLEMNVKEKIRMYLQLQITDGDKLPDQVCPSCSNALMAWSEFAESCSATEKRLRELLNVRDEDASLSKKNPKPKVTVVKISTIKNNSESVLQSDLLAKNSAKIYAVTNVDTHADKKVPNSDTFSKSVSRSDSLTKKTPKIDVIINIDSHTEDEAVVHSEADNPGYETSEVNTNDTSNTEDSEDKTNILFLRELFAPSALKNSKNNVIKCSTNSGSQSVKKISNGKNKDNKCYICRIRFPNFLLWASHTAAAHPRKIYRSARSKDHLDSDEESAISEEDTSSGKTSQKGSETLPAFKCSVCLTLFTSSLTLASHVMAAHSKKKFFCSCCSEEFDDEAHLEMHEAKHVRPVSEDPLFKICSVCNQSFLKSEFKNHLNSHLYCTVCMKVFKNEDEIKEHKKKHSYLCEMCGKTLVTRGSYVLHLQTHAPADQLKTYECAECGLTYKYRSGLKRHMLLTHSENKNAVCELCGKIISRVNYKLHIAVVHSQDYTHSCEVCDKKFRHITHLNNHKKTHFARVKKTNVSKPVQCKKCTKCFATKTGMLLHMNFHDLSRHSADLVCSTCGRMCRSTETFKKHVLLHKGSKPFKCKICGRNFATEIYRDAHECKNPGESLFQCKRCDKRFVSKTLYGSHSRHCNRSNTLTQTHAEGYRCSVCSRNFVKISDVKKHMKTHSNLQNLCDVISYKEEIDISESCWEVVVADDPEV